MIKKGGFVYSKIPKVSVILPTYNREKTVSRAIESVLAQTFTDFELIIIDDGSTDNTKEIVNKFKDERIVYVRYNENRERSAARNSGIKISRGKYIAFLDSDDEWIRDKLKKQVNLVENSKENVGVVYTGYTQVWDNLNGRKITNPFIDSVEKLEGNIYEELKKGDFVLPSSVLVKKKVFEKVGLFDEKIYAGEAWDLWVRISEKFLFSFIEEPLVVRYINNDSLSGFSFDPFRVVNTMLRVSEKLDINFNKQIFKWFFSNFRTTEEFLEYTRENTQERVIIFGASARGIAIFKYLLSKGIKFNFFVDNDKKKWGKKIEDIEIKSPDAIEKEDIVIIGSAWWKEIAKQLIHLGVTKMVAG
ncbi:glycosyltransferase [Hippea sp. KM1]|uniref:glycosyltransferase n=1 Tax=Hippea sp. KM1 TaxID=944481 RepID=UPI00046CAE24|nr:glycosyltransferase [Hippea sp. KM1]